MRWPIETGRIFRVVILLVVVVVLLLVVVVVVVVVAAAADDDPEPEPVAAAAENSVAVLAGRSIWRAAESVIAVADKEGDTDADATGGGGVVGRE